jgi:hypothetical protein
MFDFSDWLTEISLFLIGYTGSFSFSLLGERKDEEKVKWLVRALCCF